MITHGTAICADQARGALGVNIGDSSLLNRENRLRNCHICLYIGVLFRVNIGIHGVSGDSSLLNHEHQTSNRLRNSLINLTPATPAKLVAGNVDPSD